MVTSELQKPTDISYTIESSSSSMSLSLKALEYLCLAALVCAGIFIVVFPDNQKFVIGAAVSFASFIFFFLLNKQVFQNSNNSANQSALTNKAELYNYLLTSNSLQKSSLTPAREKALQYCQELIDDYRATRTQSRNIYYSLQLATVVFSGVTPILVLVDKLEAGVSWLKWLPVICPAIASIVASIVTSFPFQENWISANETVELLEAEQEKFILGVTPLYRCYDLSDETQCTQKAKTAIENFINQVNNIHLKQIQGNQVQFKEEAPADKPAESNQALETAQ